MRALRIYLIITALLVPALSIAGEPRASAGCHERADAAEALAGRSRFCIFEEDCRFRAVLLAEDGGAACAPDDAARLSRLAQRERAELGRLAAEDAKEAHRLLASGALSLGSPDCAVALKHSLGAHTLDPLSEPIYDDRVVICTICWRIPPAKVAIEKSSAGELLRWRRVAALLYGEPWIDRPMDVQIHGGERR